MIIDYHESDLRGKQVSRAISTQEWGDVLANNRSTSLQAFWKVRKVVIEIQQGLTVPFMARIVVETLSRHLKRQSSCRAVEHLCAGNWWSPHNAGIYFVMHNDSAELNIEDI